MYPSDRPMTDGTDARLTSDRESDPGRVGAWPGIAALEFGDGFPLAGREDDVDRLERLLVKPKAGQSAMVWLHGDSGVGKTSLVSAGLLPRLSNVYGEGFEWVVHRPARRESVESFIFSTAEAVLTKVVAGESGVAPLETRMRQFCLLLEQDSVESAAEYLASCFRQSMTVRRGREEDTLCLLALDQLDRLGPEGDVFPGEDSDWGEVALIPWIGFLSELCLTGAFACVAAMRSPNFAVLGKALERAGLSGFGTPVRVMSLEKAETNAFFERMPAPQAQAGVVETTPELIEFLFGSGDEIGGLIPFVSETLRRLSEIDPGAEKLTVDDARWAGGMERSFSVVAENAIRERGLGGDHRTFFELMSMLYPDDDFAGGYTAKDPARLAMKEIAYRDLREWPEMRATVDALVDARAMVLRGDSPERACFAWALPAGLVEWPRSREWIEQHDRLIGLAKKFDESRQEWDKEQRSQVRLLHASVAIRDARDLLEYHRKRPILSEALIEYLEESVSLDQKLERPSLPFVRIEIAWLKKAAAIIAGGMILLVLVFLLWKLMT